MIVGLGTDIVNLERMAKLVADDASRLVAKICTPAEEQYVASGNKVSRLAKVWAAKEAAVKALGTGFAKGVSFKDITLTHDSLGKPELTFSGRAAEILQTEIQANSARILVSLSDDKPFVQAVVIIEKI
jgi:holo-[acyl-carrier protein] synthase